MRYHGRLSTIAHRVAARRATQRYWAGAESHSAAPINLALLNAATGSSTSAGRALPLSPPPPRIAKHAACPAPDTPEAPCAPSSSEVPHRVVVVVPSQRAGELKRTRDENKKEEE